MGTELNRKANWMNSMKRELQGLKDGPELDIHLDSL